jgi:hypothetical protein
LRLVPPHEGCRLCSETTSAKHHRIVAHEVTNVASHRSQLINTATAAKEALGADGREAVADRGYSSGEETGEQSHVSLYEWENAQKLHRYWTNACRRCAPKAKCTEGNERRITRWEHEAVVDAVQNRLDANPGAMRTRRETVEHPFGTIKMRMGATHFLCKRSPPKWRSAC